MHVSRLSENTMTKITALRHALHRCPELSMEETETIRTLQHFLQENTSLEVCPRDGWFYAVKRAGGRPDGDSSCAAAGCMVPGAPAGPGSVSMHETGNTPAALPAGLFHLPASTVCAHCHFRIPLFSIKAIIIVRFHSSFHPTFQSTTHKSHLHEEKC